MTEANTATDWTAVHALLLDSFAYMEARLGHPARASQATARDLAVEARQGPVLLWLDTDDTLAGCLFCRPSRDHPGALYVGKLAVAQALRGQGVARHLIDAAADLARRSGYTALTLDTGTQFPELHDTFQRLGFNAPVPRQGEPGVVTMIRSLPAG